jgi:hypothetical protein
MMTPNIAKSPARVEAGRRNRQARGPLTEAGRQVLRESALRHQPWQWSTGPRTEEGKRRAAANGRCSGKNAPSQHQLRPGLADIYRLLTEMGGARRAVYARNA